MSEEKLYAVKNDDGEWADPCYTFGPGAWVTSDKTEREEGAKQHGGHVVTLIEEPKPLVVPEWFDKWLDAFCRQGDGYSWRELAVVRILQQGWSKSINDSYQAFDSHWAIPHVENKQVDYVLNHKKELMVAALTGNYTVEKEKKYLVYKELGGKQKNKHEQVAQAYRSNLFFDTIIWLIKEHKIMSSDASDQFTEAEIEHYGLQDCEKEEVTDDGE